MVETLAQIPGQISHWKSARWRQRQQQIGVLFRGERRRSHGVTCKQKDPLWCPRDSDLSLPKERNERALRSIRPDANALRKPVGCAVRLWLLLQPYAALAARGQHGARSQLMSEKPPDSNCCSSCDSKATLVRSASGHFLKRIGCIEKSDRTENCIGVSERLDAKQKVKGSCDTGTPTQQVGYSLLLQRRDCRKMDPYVLIRGLKFPRDYSPSKISDSEAPRRRKAGIVPKLYGRLTCGKSVIAYVCHHCNKIFTNQLAIQNHVRNECECFKNVLKCELCDKIFTGSDLHNYVLHKELKHSMRCSVCSKSFITERRLVLHRRSQHPEIKFYYQCDLCRKGFKTKPKLLEHYKDHRRQEASEVTKLKQYRCSYCRQVCFGFKKLTAHYREHQTEKRLAEEETRRLSAYDKVRKRRKRKKSDVSIRNFPTVGTLPFEGRKIYVCYLCNIYFNEACELRDHMENHVDGVCMKCHIDFSTSADLKIHQNLIHYYKCKTCYLTFVKKSHRKNHKISCKGVKNGIKL